MPTSGRLSHATQVPLVSVNLSMTRTVLMMPETGSAMLPTPELKTGAVLPPPSGTSQLLLLRSGLCRSGSFLRPVVVRRERVRREHEALRRHHVGRVRALRFQRLLEERALRGLLGGDLVPGLEELDQDVGRGAQDAHAVLLLELLQRVGVLPLPLRPPDHERLARDRLHHLLVLGLEALPDVAVHYDFADRDVLVHARRVVILPDVVEAQAQVLDAADPLGAVDH